MWKKILIGAAAVTAVAGVVITAVSLCGGKKSEAPAAVADSTEPESDTPDTDTKAA